VEFRYEQFRYFRLGCRNEKLVFVRQKKNAQKLVLEPVFLVSETSIFSHLKQRTNPALANLSSIAAATSPKTTECGIFIVASKEVVHSMHYYALHSMQSILLRDRSQITSSAG